MEEKGPPTFVLALARLSRFRLVHCYQDCNLLAANFSPFASVPVNFDRDKFLTESGRYVSADNKYLFVVRCETVERSNLSKILRRNASPDCIY